jgi:hypothetical protein
MSEKYLTRALKELHISGFALAKILNLVRNIEMSQFLKSSFCPCGEGQILYLTVHMREHIFWRFMDSIKLVLKGS